jgi:hypothetical protein
MLENLNAMNERELRHYSEPIYVNELQLRDAIDNYDATMTKIIDRCELMKRRVREGNPSEWYDGYQQRRTLEAIECGMPTE